MSSNNAEKTQDWPQTKPTTKPRVEVVKAVQPEARPQKLTTRNAFLPLTLGLTFIAALFAAAYWWHYQASHLVSRNALVRSHISQLGMRGEGVIEAVFVNAGDTVKKGDLLAQLGNQHILAERAAADARLNTIEQKISVKEAAIAVASEHAIVDLRAAKLAYEQQLAMADASHAQAADAAAVHAARKALGTDGAVSTEAIRGADATAQYRASQARAADAAAAGSLAKVEAARLAIAEIAVQRQELAVLEAQRDEIEADIRRVMQEFDRTRITAPANGAVIRRLAQPGMAISTGMPLLSLWLTDDTWIEAWVPEEDLGTLATGSTVTVSFAALPEAQFAGTVDQIGLATDFEMPADYLPQTREARMRPTPQVGIRIRLDDTPERLRPGMSAVVDIQRSDV